MRTGSRGWSVFIKEIKMFNSYLYPNYRSSYFLPYAYPNFGYGMPYGYGYGNYSSSNIIGSAIANQNLVNTGNMIGVNQTATPTVIW
jgi:hypothetical protein